MYQKVERQSIASTIKASVKDSTIALSHPDNIYWEIIDIQKHLPLIDQWIRLPYSKSFWQMDHLSFDELHDHYTEILHGDNGTSLIGHYEGKPICQVELYDCRHDEISLQYDAQHGDIGLHFLMAPIEGNKIANLSVTMMRSIISILLRNNEIVRILGEPDVRNEKANTLVTKAGFRFLKQITMSYKTANLYECTRDSFHQ